MVLTGGVVYAANWIALNNTRPENSQALVITPTPIYVTVYVTPSAAATATPVWLKPHTPTPAASITPTAAITATPVITHTTTPSPTPTRRAVTDNTPVACGPLDVNGDMLLNYTDYLAMVAVYNLPCTDTPYPHVFCGGMDTNDDRIVNYKDLAYLSSHYYPNVVNCQLY